MSDEPNRVPGEKTVKENPEEAPLTDEELLAAPDSAAFKALLREAMETKEIPAEGEILQGVQRKLRQRSRGKFYGDQWSVGARSSNVLLVALTVVLVLGIAWFVLAPLSTH